MNDREDLERLCAEATALVWSLRPRRSESTRLECLYQQARDRELRRSDRLEEYNQWWIESLLEAEAESIWCEERRCK